MGRILLRYTFGAVALYLGVRYASNAGRLIVDGAQGYAIGVEALQGRSPQVNRGRR